MTSSSSLCPIRERKGKLEILLIRRAFWHQRKERPLRYPGEWAFPGGMREPEDKDLIHTAKREFKEELGYARDIPDIFFLRKGRHASGNFTISFYGARIDPRHLRITDPDIIDYAWKTPDAWLGLILSKPFVQDLEREYKRRKYGQKKYGEFAITRRRFPVENIKTIQLLKRKEKDYLRRWSST